jgi:formyl-CoA transferase
MARPLDGLKVVEIGTVITAPLSASLLGELGAEVIKIERPEGDPFRNFAGGNYSPQFRAYNKNKKSVVLDLSTADDRAKLTSLLATADVLVDNFRPGVLARLGLGDDRLQAINPRLIRCSITGFGSGGPYAKRPAYDAVAQALAGISSLFLDQSDPRPCGPTISDNISGMYAALGILAAVNERNRTGVGRRVEVSMLEASIAFIPDAFALSDGGVKVGPTSRVSASQSYALACSDGKVVALHLSSQPKFWEALCEAMDANELRASPRFAAHKDRFANYAALSEELASIFSRRTRADWMKRLEAHDIPFAPVNEIEEVANDPQVKHLDTFYRATASDGTQVRSINCPIWFDGERVEPQTAPPLLGEHDKQTV